MNTKNIANMNTEKFKNIPQEMKEFPNWVYHENKVPFTVQGFPAKANDPTTWTTLDTLLSDNNKRYDGVGFEFGNSPYMGIDIDHCYDSVNGLSEMAKEIIQLCNSYTELSPSGTGVHIIMRGSCAGTVKRNTALGLEMYDTGRYFTMTGNVLDLKPINENPAAIEDIYNKYLADKKEPVTPVEENQDSLLTPDEIISKLKSQKEKRGYDLFCGKWEKYFSSQSEADLSLINSICFYAGRNNKLIDEVFRKSSLYRLKWEEKRGKKTYGQITIEKAISDCTQVYEPKNIFPKVDNNNKPLKECYENVEYLFQKWNIKVALNLIDHSITYGINKNSKSKPLLIEDPSNFDVWVNAIRGKCAGQGLKIFKSDLIDHIQVIAYKNRYNPWLDYLNKAKEQWQGEDVLKKVFACLNLNCDSLAIDFSFILLKKWLISAVALAQNDTGLVNAQGVLILQGNQGIGKTRFAKWLMQDVPSLLRTGEFLDPHNKDTIISCTTCAMCELGEFGRTMKEVNYLKAFFSNSCDVLRKPYGKSYEKYPRRTAFIGTINETEFLIDSTGERRYWILPIKSIDWEKLDSIEPLQLWGQIMTLSTKENYWLTYEQVAMVNKRNEANKKHTSEEQAILDYCSWGSKYEKQFSSSQLCRVLGLPANYNAKVGRALNKLVQVGKLEKPMGINGYGSTRFYSIPVSRAEFKRD